jgi:predicted O-methyltransferase YrrM
MRLRMLSSLLLRGRPPWKGSSSAAVLLYLARTAQRTRARLVGEIGFDAGFSSRAFLQSPPRYSGRLVRLGRDPLGAIAKKLIDKRFPGRHTLMWGDSRTTGPEFTASPPGLEFDLVFIDGGHSYEVARADLLNLRELSSESTAVIMNDLVPRYAFGVGPTWAWNNAIVDGLVRQNERVRDSRMRSWALGHYVFQPGPRHT